jgi:hypothetical protein
MNQLSLASARQRDHRRAGEAYAWTVRSTTARFPRWIHFGCGGRSLRVGADTDPE